MSDLLSVIPLDDRILIEVKKETETPGGIKLPEDYGAGDAKFGKVRAIGLGVPSYGIDGTDPDRKSRGMKVGDTVYLPRGLKTGDVFSGESSGNLFVCVPYKYISAIMND